MEPINLIDDLMTHLRLSGMKHTLGERIKEAQSQQMSYEGFLNLILHDEATHRQNEKVKRLLKRASFKQQASLEGLDYSTPRGLDKKQISSLSSFDFVKKGRNVIISGPTGVGKSFLATAFGNNACRMGLSVAFFRLNSLIEKFMLERLKGTYLNILKRLSGYDLVILDDFGIKPLEAKSYQDLYDLIDERGDDKSLILTTQLPPSNWNEVIDDPVTCEAITDRITGGSTKIIMKGSSYRQKRGTKKAVLDKV